MVLGTGSGGGVWPVVLTDGRVGLRPISRRDSSAWFEVRARNTAWLRPWEATAPDGSAETPRTYRAMVKELLSQARRGRCLPFVVTLDDRLVGQLTVSGITYGSARWAQVGYWVDSAVAGHGITPTAVALVADHCFGAAGLHRLEVNIRPENAASLRVVDKLGFRPEGLRPRFLHIDGAWRDHLSFSMVTEDVPGGLLVRWHQTQREATAAALARAAPPRDVAADGAADTTGFGLVAPSGSTGSRRVTQESADTPV